MVDLLPEIEDKESNASSPGVTVKFGFDSNKDVRGTTQEDIAVADAPETIQPELPTGVDLLPEITDADTIRPISSEADLPQEELTFAKGFGIEKDSSFADWAKSVAQDSVLLKAGGVLTEQASKVVAPELFDTNRGSELFNKWMPQIWDAEDKLNGIKDQRSDEYQEADSQIKLLKKNFVDDKNGNYIPPPSEPIDVGKMFDAVRDNPGFMLGSMAKAMAADPELLLVPGGWTKAAFKATQVAKKLSLGKKATTVAEMSAKIAGGASVAGVLGATFDVVEQLDKNPVAPFSADSVLKTASTFAMIGGALPPVFSAAGLAAKGTGKAVDDLIAKPVSEFYTKAKIDQIIKESQKIFRDADGALTKQAAVKSAVAKIHPFDQEKIISKLDPDRFLSNEAIVIALSQGERNASFPVIVKRLTVERFDAIADNWNAMVEPVMTSIRRLGLPETATRLLRHEMNYLTDLSNKLAIKDAYSKAYKSITGGLSKSDRQLADWHLFNGTFDSVKDSFPKSFVEAVENVHKMFRKELGEMKEVGLIRENGGKENYWARSLDYKKWLESKGLNTDEGFRLFAKAINKKYKLKGTDKYKSEDLNEDLVTQLLTHQELAFAVVDQVASKTAKTPGIIATSGLRKRTVDVIPLEDMKFYAPSNVSLTQHINKMTVLIHDRKFFGGKALKKATEREDLAKNALDGSGYNDDIIDGMIADFANDLVKNKKALPETIDKLIPLLEARFKAGVRKPRKFLLGIKNLMYSIVLGNPYAASIQLGDLGSSAYMNQVHRTSATALKVIARQNKIKMDDFGLQAMAHEFETQGWTAKLLDTTLKVGTFKAADVLGKETILNASLGRGLSMVTPKKLAAPKGEEKALAYFKERYGKQLGDDEVQGIMDGFISGDIRDSNLRLALFSDLTKVQPVTLSEMPTGYLNHPDLRILYMLKTFTIKQIDLMRNEVIQEFADQAKSGTPMKGAVEASVKLGKLLATIGLANAGVDATRRFLLGEDFEFTDTMFASALRTWGYSPYAVRKIEEGELMLAAVSMVSPPVKTLTNPVMAAFGKDPKGKAWESLPLVGWIHKFQNNEIKDPFPNFDDDLSTFEIDF